MTRLRHLLLIIAAMFHGPDADDIAYRYPDPKEPRP